MENLLLQNVGSIITNCSNATAVSATVNASKTKTMMLSGHE